MSLCWRIICWRIVLCEVPLNSLEVTCSMRLEILMKWISVEEFSWIFFPVSQLAYGWCWVSVCGCRMRRISLCDSVSTQFPSYRSYRTGFHPVHDPFRINERLSCTVSIRAGGRICTPQVQKLINAGWLVAARKRSLGQGNIFTSVCHSVHGGGGHAWQGAFMAEGMCGMWGACVAGGHA